jgi:undecaprenyl-phosphate 4-deoxy-4-formamido-L-arabinose transferase
MIFEITSKIGQIEVSHNERASGKSNYNFFKLLKLYSNMVFGFSIKPLRYIAIIGIILFIFSLIIGGIIIFEKLFISDVPLGYSSLIISIIFFSSVQLIFIGVLSEYVGKILKNSSNAPQYSIDQIYKKDD